MGRGPPTEALLVGGTPLKNFLGADSPHDVLAAREAGVVSIAAAWADAASIPKLLEAEPDALFTSVETLSEWLGE